jgi:hypothetical protein
MAISGHPARSIGLQLHRESCNRTLEVVMKFLRAVAASIIYVFALAGFTALACTIYGITQVAPDSVPRVSAEDYLIGGEEK